MFFSRRRRSGRDRLLPVKMATLLVGGVLGLIGMSAGNARLVNVAIVVVLLGFLLRFLPQPRDPHGHETNTPPPPPTGQP